MMASRIVNTSRQVVLLVAMLVAIAPTVSAAQDSGCSGIVVGKVRGIQVSAEEVEVAPADQIKLIRGASSPAVQNGMPLCAGDDVTVQGDSVLVMSLGDSIDNQADITLYAFATVELADPRSIFVRVGRMFATLRGIFEARLPFARLGAKGTEFQVNVTDNGAEIIQLEGELDVEPLNVVDGMIPGIDPNSIFRASFQAQDPYSYSRRERKKMSQQPPVTLGRLSTLVLSADGKTPPRVSGAGEDVVRKTIDENASAILAAQPAEPSAAIPRNFNTKEERARVYREARFRSVWSPEDKRSFEALGDVYLDWGHPRKALRSYEKAGENEDTGRQIAINYNNLGNAYRLAGMSKEAQSYFEKALRANPRFAFPYNGLGDVYQDLARAEIDRGNSSAAENLLSKADEYYNKSLDRSLWGKEGGQNRAIPLYHLGENALLKGKLDDSEHYFHEALKEAPSYPFARIGLGRVSATRSQIALESGNSGESASQLESARAAYNSVLETNPKFAPAQLALGETFEQQGDWKSASQYFQRATQSDPSFAQAYYKSGVALQKTGDKDLSRNYFSTYLISESPLLRKGKRAEVAIRAIDMKGIPDTEQKPETKPEQNSDIVAVPPLSGISLREAEQVLKKAGLKKGKVHYEDSEIQKDSILRQNPEPGAGIKPGSKVELWCSNGPPQPVEVPNVVGMKSWEAMLVLGFKQLQVRSEEVNSGTEKGKIIRQDPAAGTTVMQRTEVVVYVSNGTGE